MQRRVQELHIGPALVDASMVRSRRADACQGRASTSLTTTRLHSIARMRSSDSIEASLYQVLHRTTPNEPLRIVAVSGIFPDFRGMKKFKNSTLG